MSKNLLHRIISAIVLIPIVFFALIKGGIAYYALLAIAFPILFYEWFSITVKNSKALSSKIKWGAFGIFYLGTALFAFYALSTKTRYILPVLIIIWIADSSAYFFGKKWGKKKLAPKISPGKTWVGFFAAILIPVIIIFTLASIFLGMPKVTYTAIWEYIGLALYISLVAFLSQVGDLFESWVKRKFNVKDSGNIIPGHGGLLDRLDGVLFVFAILGIFIFAKIMTEIL